MQPQFLKLLLPAFLFIFIIIFIFLYGFESRINPNSHPESSFPQLNFQRTTTNPNTIESVTAAVVNFEKRQSTLSTLLLQIKVEKTIIELDIREFQTFPVTDAEVLVKIENQTEVKKAKTDKNGIVEFTIDGDFSVLPKIVVSEITGYKCTNCPLEYVP